MSVAITINPVWIKNRWATLPEPKPEPKPEPPKPNVRHYQKHPELRGLPRDEYMRRYMANLRLERKKARL